MVRRMKMLLCFVLVIITLVGCTPTSNSNTEPSQPVVEADPMELLEQRLAQYAQLGTSPDDNYRVWYEIFVYSFCDSNGDGIGDLKGATSKLDYLQELGINGIWLMPIHPSSSYHKYDVNDYYEIDPQYGTMADFEEFIAECDKRGIKVIIDLVVNHSGWSNPWFQEACNYLRTLSAGQEPDPEECKYVEYYNFYTEKKSSCYSVTGSNYFYEGQFSSSMPDLNWGCEALREDIRDVMEFWLNKGVGGFRVDAAKEFYTGSVLKNAEVLNWLQTTATSIKEDAYMVAEAWDNSELTISEYYTSGMVSIFNYPFGNNVGKLTKTVNARGNAALINKWAGWLETAHKRYSETNPDYIDAPFLSNHDVGRIYDFVNGDILRVKMASAMNLFMSGSAFIYYGEEIGMPGIDARTTEQDDESQRAPMYWNAERDNGTTTPPSGCILPESYPFGSVEEQKNDASSVYNYYRELIAIRKALPVISHGYITAETALNVGCVSAMRKTWNDQECIILLNIDDNEAGAEVDLSAYTDWEVVATLSANGESITQDGSTLKLPAYGIAVLTPKN